MLPYTCRYCGGTFCDKHRLPENHSCDGLGEIPRRRRSEGGEVRGRPEEEEEEAPHRRPTIYFKVSRGPGEGRGPREERSRRIGGLFSFLKALIFRQATMIMLFVIFVVYIAQQVALGVYGTDYLLYVAPTRATVLTRPWTVLTSIFIHGGPFHFLINSMVLFFIGPAVENRMGKERFVTIFLGAGMAAAVGQILVSAPHVPVLGASGAILGALGALTALEPKMPVLFLFIIPMQLWIFTLGFGVYTIVFALTGLAEGIGHVAHLTGLIIGLLYGLKIKGDIGGRGRRSIHPLAG